MTQAPPEAPSSPPPPAGPKTSGLAIASLVCGIAGFCTGGLAGIVGLILGIVALCGIGKSQGQRKGKGLAIAGIVVSIVSLVALVAFVLPALHQARALANEAASKSNLKQLCNGAHLYATSHRQIMPPADSWPQVLTQEFGISDRGLSDPADPDAGRGYAINRYVAGQPHTVANQPVRTVLFFECRFGSPTAGAADLLADEPRHPNGYVIGFIDGHVESISPEMVGGLIWDPRAGRPVN